MWVKRTYGKIFLKDETGAEVQSSKYHEYSLQERGPLDMPGKTPGSAEPQCRLYHILPDAVDSAIPPKTFQHLTDLHHQGMLRLQQGDESSRYVQFEDSRGNVTGALEANEQGRGVVLRSPAGDMAEWYPRLPNEPPFEEAEVVACVFAVQLRVSIAVIN